MPSLSDFVIRNARVYDGSGGAPFEADVALEGGRISAIGSLPQDATPRDRRARPGALTGLHRRSHARPISAAVLHPDMAFKLLGGVTTCVVGNCGMGAAPHRAAVGMAKAFHPHARHIPEWEGYRGYLDRLDAQPAAVNVAALVGHGSLRLDAMGGARREPSAAEMRTMKDNLHEGLEAGAVGLSTGLIYEPGRHARSDEIIELATEMAGTGALYATHMRDEGERLLESVGEAIEIGERAGVPVQISHHKASGRESWGRCASPSD